MSRIGKQPIPIPTGVTVSVDGFAVHVKGPKGELTTKIHPLITVAVKDSAVVCEVKRPTKQTAALWGTTRANIANMVTGVTEGFTKQLELQGVGYRATLKGKNLEMALGFSHPVLITAPEGISFTVEKEFITIAGIDTVKVGQVAADIRKIRPPEPYKGKGVRYVGEKVRRKVGKVVGTTA
ncbi:MAG: 50S ribosomal protein L6 [Candidatus Andersenbacteria bacterium]